MCFALPQLSFEYLLSFSFSLSIMSAPFIAIVRRLPGGRGIKQPRNPNFFTAIPVATRPENVRSYFRLWSKNATRFINYGSTRQHADLQRTGLSFYSSIAHSHDSVSPLARDAMRASPSLAAADAVPGLLHGGASSLGGASSGASNTCRSSVCSVLGHHNASFHPLPSVTAASTSLAAANSVASAATAATTETAAAAMSTNEGPVYPSSSPSADVAPRRTSKFSIRQLAERRGLSGKALTMITAYDAPTASLAERAGVDMILVGDSVGMVVLGYENTTAVTMDEMIHHCKAVVRGAKLPFIVGDMPFGAYLTPDSAVANAARLLKEGGVDAVKLEGGERVARQVRAIVDAGIPVIGHIGLTPQSQAALGGFVLQGKTVEAAKQVLCDAIAIQQAGASAIVLEMIPAPVAAYITEALQIPTIGIGAGAGTSGQVLVLHDMYV